MNKKIKFLALVLLFTGITSFAASPKTQMIKPSAPQISASLKPIISDYRSGNYIQSMIKLEDLIKKEPNNSYAMYYLALTYTQLGKKEDAETCYNAVVKQNSNMSLVYYSKKALACIDHPTDGQCLQIKSTNKPDKLAEETQEGTKAEDDDITKFIKSGKMIHPAAADAITRERMERKLQADEYFRRQKESNSTERESYIAPSKEEIIAAYEVLKRAGLDPFNTDNTINELAYNNKYSMGLPDILSGNNDIQIMLYNQLLQNRNTLNYGI